MERLSALDLDHDNDRQSSNVSFATTTEFFALSLPPSRFVVWSNKGKSIEHIIFLLCCLDSVTQGRVGLHDSKPVSNR